MQQIKGQEGHWHFFYSVDELQQFIGGVIKAHDLRIREDADGPIFLSFGKKS